MLHDAKHAIVRPATGLLHVLVQVDRARDHNGPDRRDRDKPNNQCHLASSRPPGSVSPTQRRTARTTELPSTWAITHTWGTIVSRDIRTRRGTKIKARRSRRRITLSLERPRFRDSGGTPGEDRTRHPAAGARRMPTSFSLNCGGSSGIRRLRRRVSAKRSLPALFVQRGEKYSRWINHCCVKRGRRRINFA